MKKAIFPQGDSQEIDVYVKGADGIAFSLVGCSIEWLLSKGTASTALLRLHIGEGITVINAAGGVFRISLSATQTAALLGEYYHQARLTLPSGEVKTILRQFLSVFDTVQ